MRMWRCALYRPLRQSLVVAVLASSAVFAQAPPRTAAGPSIPSAGTCEIGGAVVATIDGQQVPVRRARVIARANTGAPAEQTDTDTDGRFHINSLSSGVYQIEIDKPGFVPLGRVPAVVLADGQRVTITVPMQRGAAIEGQLLTDGGEPAMGLTVSAIRLGYGPYGKTSVAIRQTTTDDLGRYRIHTLPAGEFYLEVAPDPTRMLQSPGVPAPVPRPTHVYYPGTPRLNDARSVTLDAGQQMSNVDFTVATASLSSLTAHVTTAAGSVPPNASFAATMQRVGAPPGEVRCLSAQGGVFQCLNIPPGEFWLLVTGKSAPDSPAEFSATRVTVDGHQTTAPLTLTVTTTAAVTVAGRVETDGGVPLPSGLEIAAAGTDYEFPPPGRGGSSTPVAGANPDGTFAMANVAGPRLLRVTGLPKNWTLSSVSLGTMDISDTPTSFGGDAGLPLRILVTSRTGSVAGVVRDSADQPAEGRRVTVFGDDPNRWGARSRFIQTREIGPDGRYDIDGLLPGKYFLSVVDALDDGACNDPDVLARLQSSAASIVVTAGSTVTRNWKLP